MNIGEYIMLRKYPYDKKVNKSDKKVEKPYNNRTIYGNSIKTHLADKISISKPKKWPVKGYFEKD